MLFAADAAATAAVAAARAGSERGDRSDIRVRPGARRALFYVFAVKMARSSCSCRRTSAGGPAFLPRWLIGFGVVGALLMLFSVGFLEPLALIFPAWVVFVSILLLRATPTWGAAWADARRQHRSDAAALVGDPRTDANRTAERPGP